MTIQHPVQHIVSSLIFFCLHSFRLDTLPGEEKEETACLEAKTPKVQHAEERARLGAEGAVEMRRGTEKRNTAPPEETDEEDGEEEDEEGEEDVGELAASEQPRDVEAAAAAAAAEGMSTSEQAPVGEEGAEPGRRQRALPQHGKGEAEPHNADEEGERHHISYNLGEHVHKST